MEINDGELLQEVIDFCDKIENKKLKGSASPQKPPKHPLDNDVKKQLEVLEKNLDRRNEDCPELPYTVCKEMDRLWNDLIEKSIMCLRFFDKREPFIANNRIPFAYGLDELTQYHEKYIDFESELYGSDTYYRDHVFHVIRVWLLGVFLLLNENNKLTDGEKSLIELIHFEGENVSGADEQTVKQFEDKPLTAEQEAALKKGAILYKDNRDYKIISDNEKNLLVGLNCFCYEINVYEKISMWTIIALCHDLGYPLEKSKKVLEKTEKMMGFFVAQPNINGNIRFDGTRDSNNKDIILFSSKKMKAEKPQNDDIYPLYKASVQEKYKFKYMLSLESFKHGVISSIIIYKMLIYFKEADNNSDANYIFEEEDARQFYIRRDMLRAMASHTCRDIYHIDVATFPMLLFVCDELQEWGRKSWKDLYVGTSNGSRRLRINAYNCSEISYMEYINMKKAKRNEIVGNIKRILEQQYLLYQTTFRDGQDTSRRKFNLKKHIDIKIGKAYKSIEKILIVFEINHDKINTFSLQFKDSGNSIENEQETEQLKHEIEEFINQYKDNKYGNVCLKQWEEGK